MARVLHPGYFPIQIENESCGSLYLPGNLLKSMELYWRVKKWAFFYQITFNAVVEKIQFNLDLSSPPKGEKIENESDLVCPKAPRWEEEINQQYTKSYSLILDSTGLNGSGISINVDHGEGFGGFTAPVQEGQGNLKAEITMGRFNTKIDASGPFQSTICKLTAFEWWPYKDAQGRALYNTSTGQRI